MSLKGNASSAKLPTEQLRSDHIGTLELLQKCTNENVKLKKELKLLKADKNQSSSTSEDTTTLSVPDTLDSLELVETNTKQAEEIKLLKSRLSQAELQLLKFNQLQTVLQQNSAQSVTIKLKKKEGEMDAAIIELENQLRSANVSLSDLQKQKDHLVEEVKELKHINSEVYIVNGNLTATIGILHAQLSALKSELEQDKKSIEVAAEQKLNDSRKLLAVQLEQSAVLKKELSLQVEAAFRLQESNAQLVADKNTADATCKSLHTNVTELSGVILEQQRQIQKLQNADSGEQDESETFKFTAPIIEVDPTKAISEADGDATSRFQEFLRLKRENKELKIRLAEMETSRRVPVGDGKHAHALMNTVAALASSSHPHLQSSLQGSLTGSGLASSTTNSPRPIVGSVKKPPAGNNGGVSTKTRNTLK